MYHHFCKYQYNNSFSYVVKCVRPTYGNKDFFGWQSGTYGTFSNLCNIPALQMTLLYSRIHLVGKVL